MLLVKIPLDSSLEDSRLREDYKVSGFPLVHTFTFSLTHSEEFGHYVVSSLMETHWARNGKSSGDDSLRETEVLLTTMGENVEVDLSQLSLQMRPQPHEHHAFTTLSETLNPDTPI